MVKISHILAPEKWGWIFESLLKFLHRKRNRINSNSPKFTSTGKKKSYISRDPLLEPPNEIYYINFSELQTITRISHTVKM